MAFAPAHPYRLGSQPAAPLPAALRPAGDFCATGHPILVRPGTPVVGPPANRGPDWHIELDRQVSEPAQDIFRAIDMAGLMYSADVKLTFDHPYKIS